MKLLSPEEEIAKRWQIIESIQSSFVSAGGKFFTRKEIEKMTVEELLNMSIPNFVKILVSYDSEAYINYQKK